MSKDYFRYRPERETGVIVTTLRQLKDLVRKLKDLEEFAFDTETNTLQVVADSDFFKLVGISISWGKCHNYYIPVGHVREEDFDNQLDLEEVVRYLKPIFEREDLRLIGANIKFDMHVMARIGIFIKTKDLFDVNISSWLCDENTPNGLKDNTILMLGYPQTHFAEVLNTVPKEVKKQFGLKASSKPTADLVLIEDLAPYALDDAFFTWEQYLGFSKKLVDEEMDRVYYRSYVPFIRTLFNMEERGVTVDVEKLREMQVDIEVDIEELRYKLVELAGVEINFNSSIQLSKLLFGRQPEPKMDFDAYDKWRRNGDNDRDCSWSYGSDKDREKEYNGYVKNWETENSISQHSFGFSVIDTTASGAPSTGSHTLWKLSKLVFTKKRKKEGVEFVKNLMVMKKLTKLKTAFIDGLLEQLYLDGKAHPSFNIIGTDSGRISCKEPNLQQLPKAEDDDKYQIRSVFIGSEDPVTGKRKKIIACDFSNLEMRVLAHFSKDENLLEMFREGFDTHGSTAVNMFELDCSPNEAKKLYPHLRQAAKTINFMLMYGGGASKLYASLKDDPYSPIDLGEEEYLKKYHCRNGVEVAQVYIDKYFKAYSGVAKFMRSQKRFAHKNGYVYTLLRRKRRLPDINSMDMKKSSYCERLSVNSCIQGSAADLTMNAQNRMMSDPWFEEHRAYMLIQVHDEVVYECPEEYVDECMKRIQKYMAHPFGDNIELNLEMKADADFGDSYAEAK